MTKTTFLQDLITYSNPVLLLITSCLVIYKGRNRVFFWFVTYLFYVAAISYPLTAIFNFSRHLYFYAYWITDGINIGLSFLVLYEIFRNVMTEGSLRISRPTFALMNALMLLAAAILAFWFRPHDKEIVIQAILTLLSTARFAQIGLMLILLALTSFFGYYWGNLTFGITAGFGFYASMETVGIFARSRLGTSGSHLISLIVAISYQGATLIWLAYALKKPKLPAPKLPHDKVSQWSGPIKRILR